MPDRTDKQTHRVPEVEVRGSPVPAHDTAPEDVETESLFAFLSSVERSAPAWDPADQIDALAFLGSVKLDFVRADLPPGAIVEIRAMAILGSIEVVVPQGADVEVEGVPLLGSFEQKTRKRRKARERIREWVTGEAPEPDPDPPLFRVTGYALLGSVEIVTA